VHRLVPLDELPIEKMILLLILLLCSDIGWLALIRNHLVSYVGRSKEYKNNIKQATIYDKVTMRVITPYIRKEKFCSHFFYLIYKVSLFAIPIKFVTTIILAIAGYRHYALWVCICFLIPFVCVEAFERKVTAKPNRRK